MGEVLDEVAQIVRVEDCYVERDREEMVPLHAISAVLVDERMQALYRSVLALPRHAPETVEKSKQGGGLPLLLLPPDPLKIELCGYRKSYWGKAWFRTHRVRMSCWPDCSWLEWMYTLLHELTHLLDEQVHRKHNDLFWDFFEAVLGEAYSTGVLIGGGYDDMMETARERVVVAQVAARSYSLRDTEAWDSILPL